MANAFAIAVKYDAIETIQYLLDQGVPWGDAPSPSYVHRSYYKVSSTFTDALCFAIKHGARCCQRYTEFAIRNNAEQLIEAMLSPGAYPIKININALIINSNIRALMLLAKNNYSFPCGATSIAAQYDCFDVLKLLHEYGAPFSSNCATVAARRGNIRSLEFIVDNGGVMGSNIMYIARTTECIRCCHAHGATWNRAYVP